jgi:hypothetical protein
MVANREVGEESRENMWTMDQFNYTNNMGMRITVSWRLVIVIVVVCFYVFPFGLPGYFPTAWLRDPGMRSLQIIVFCARCGCLEMSCVFFTQ